MPTCSQCGETLETADAFCGKCGSKVETHGDNEGPDALRETLLIEWITERTGFADLTSRFESDVYSPYLFVVAGNVVAFVVLPVFSYLTTGFHSTIENPVRPVIIFVGLVFSVMGIRHMTTGYARAISRLDLDRRRSELSRTRFSGVVSFRSKVLAYGSAITVYYLSIVVPSIIRTLGFDTGSTVFTALSGRGIKTLIEAEGLVTTIIGQLIIVPLVNIPVILEFVMVFFGIQLLLPKRLSEADVDLFFHDPRNLGGFRDVGQLLKRSYYLYTGGVLLYFVVAYGPVIFSRFVDTPLPVPGTDVVAFFSLIWTIGLISAIYSFFKIHRLMASKKEQRLQEIESDIKELVTNPFDIRSSRVTDTQVMETKERQLREVRSTRTYPATFTMWWQLGLSVILPQALQVTVQAIL